MKSESDKFEQIDKAFFLYSQGKTAPEPVPNGWFTAAEFASHKKYSHYHANRVLKKLQNDGKIEVRKYSIKTANGGYYPTPHYKLING